MKKLQRASPRHGYLTNFAFLFLAGMIGLFSITDAHAAEKTGIISGKVSSAAVKDAALGKGAVVRIYNLYSPADNFGSKIGPTGKYSFKVPVGAYAIVSTTVDSSRLISKSKITVKNVKAKGKRVTARLQYAKIMTAAASSAGPDGPVVSVGNIGWINGSGVPFKNYDGKDWRWDDMFLTDLATTPKSCKFHVAEDRVYGKFNEILKEIKLGSSNAVDPSMRLNYRKALQTLNLWTPQFRVTGTVYSSTNEMSTPTQTNIRFVEIATGKIHLSKTYTTNSVNDFFNLPQRVARDIEEFLCKNDLPSVIQGSYTSVTTVPVFEAIENYAGNIKFVLVDPDFWRSIAFPIGVGQYAPYVAVEVSFGATISGGKICSFEGQSSQSFSKALPYGVGGILQLEIRAEPEKQRRYQINVSAASDQTTTTRVTCDDSEPFEQPKVWAPAIISPTIYEGALRVDETSMKGTHQTSIHQFGWDFTLIR